MKKLIGIAGFSWVTVKLGLTSLPHGLNFKHIVGVALMGGGGILNQDIFLVGERPLWVDRSHSTFIIKWKTHLQATIKSLIKY
jgi:Na+/H+ antiporter NhaA